MYLFINSLIPRIFIYLFICQPFYIRIYLLTYLALIQFLIYLFVCSFIYLISPPWLFDNWFNYFLSIGSSFTFYFTESTEEQHVWAGDVGFLCGPGSSQTPAQVWRQVRINPEVIHHWAAEVLWYQNSRMVPLSVSGNTLWIITWRTPKSWSTKPTPW